MHKDRGNSMHQLIFFKKMGTYLIRVGVAATLLTSLTGMAAAQDEGHRWTVNVGARFTPLVGSLNRRLDNGWNISFGGGYNFNGRFSLGGQIMYNGLGVSRGVLREFAVPDGNARIWAFTAEPRLNFAPRRKFTPYAVGGVGYYRRVVEFTQPTLAAVTVFDPFFFTFFPVLVPGNVVIGRAIRDGIGGNAGAGFQVPIGESGVKIFAEARSHYTDNGHIPYEDGSVYDWPPILTRTPKLARLSSGSLACFLGNSETVSRIVCFFGFSCDERQTANQGKPTEDSRQRRDSRLRHNMDFTAVGRRDVLGAQVENELRSEKQNAQGDQTET